ncbi:MAG TPA: class I SAM-dependent methyltransferase [Micromonosporaceae bacterium]
MTEEVRVSADWLALREPADAAARSAELVAECVRRLPVGPLTIHDLGCGTGSMSRWLAPRLASPQRWILYDRDPELLEVAAKDVPASVTSVETRCRDITRLGRGDLDGASLITASALLDMFTTAELGRFVASCAAANCPVLLTISVIGRVELTPSSPLDEEIGEAFNAHQRRTTQGHALLGPDAVSAAAYTFGRLGWDVTVRSSPWLLGPEQADLAAAWFTGWIDAACEQRPRLSQRTGDYRVQRLAEAAAGRLNVAVHHDDVLALPRRAISE